MRSLVFMLAVSVLSACSVYESSGRKYLEKSAFDLAGLKLHERLIGCATRADQSAWREVEPSDPRARVFERETPAGFELRIAPVGEPRPACDFTFVSDEERRTLMVPAVTATLRGRP